MHAIMFAICHLFSENILYICAKNKQAIKFAILCISEFLKQNLNFNILRENYQRLLLHHNLTYTTTQSKVKIEAFQPKNSGDPPSPRTNKGRHPKFSL